MTAHDAVALVRQHRRLLIKTILLLAALLILGGVGLKVLGVDVDSIGTLRVLIGLSLLCISCEFASRFNRHLAYILSILVRHE